jgi:hypothetical protein
VDDRDLALDRDPAHAATFVARGLEWATVARALGEGHTNALPWSLVRDALVAHGFAASAPFVAMATHSLGGREWRVTDPDEVPVVEDRRNGGVWHILTGETALFLHLVSATSGSTVTAEREGDGIAAWTVTLTVPRHAETGEPFRGQFASCFFDATEPPPETPAGEW